MKPPGWLMESRAGFFLVAHVFRKVSRKSWKQCLMPWMTIKMGDLVIQWSWKTPVIVEFYGGWTTGHLYRDYNKPWNKNPYESTRISWVTYICFFCLKPGFHVGKNSARPRDPIIQQPVPTRKTNMTPNIDNGKPTMNESMYFLLKIKIGFSKVNSGMYDTWTTRTTRIWSVGFLSQRSPEIHQLFGVVFWCETLRNQRHGSRMQTSRTPGR